MTLFSDDELVAIVAGDGGHWPSPLPTVAFEEPTLIVAALRGVRSLVGRGLATMDGIEYSVDESISELVRLVAAADHISAAYVADAASPGLTQGSAMYLYTKGSAAVLDLVAQTGAHDLAAVTPNEGAMLLAAFGDNVFSTGIEAAPDSVPALFVRSSASVDRAFRITKGALSTGTMTGTGETASFTESGSSGTWDESDLRELISGKA